MDEKIVKNQENRPCGCVVTTYSDDSTVFGPCIPHGLFEVANALGTAAQAMGAVATRLMQQNAEASSRQALSKIVKP